jgi:hypothetical protein
VNLGAGWEAAVIVETRIPREGKRTHEIEDAPTDTAAIDDDPISSEASLAFRANAGPTRLSADVWCGKGEECERDYCEECRLN